MKSIRPGAAAALMLLSLAWPVGLAFAATPATGSVSDASPNASWAGALKLPSAAACASDADPACDTYALTILDPGYPFQVKITLAMATAADDWDLAVYDANHHLVATSGNGPGAPESVTLTNPAAGTYTIAAAPFAPTQPYQGSAELLAVSGGGGGGSANGSEPLRFHTYTPPGLPEPDAHWARYAPTRGAGGLGLSAGEPTLGVPVANNLVLQQTQPRVSRLMYLASLQTLRLSVDSTTSPAVGLWENKSSPTHLTSLDPILEVDPTTGRTISTQLAGKRSIISLSDDDGDTWTDSPQGAGINSGVDHQTVGTGPFPPNDPIGGILGYDDATYYASQDIATAEAALSRDGGLTWGAAVPMYNLTSCNGLHGHLQVSPSNGSVFVPNKNCGGDAGFARSTDSGTTWQVVKVAGIGDSGNDPGMAVGLDGTVYFAQCGMSNAQALVAVSTDNGDHWSAPVDVGAPLGIKNCVFATMVAGDGDRAAFAFLGSTTPGAEATGQDPAAFPGAWYLYVAVTYDRGQTWTTVNATPDDPVQRGAICLQGTTCAGGRNLLDFMDIQKDEKGRVYVGYSDGCVGGCVGGGANSGTDVARIARQEPGSRSLYAAFDSEFKPGNGTLAVAPLQPYLEAYQSGNQTSPKVSLNWAQPWDGQSPITAYRVFRRTDPGSYDAAPLVTLGSESLNYLDQSVAAGTQYCYRVQAVNAAGASALQYESCAAAQPVVDPCTPPGALRGEDPAGDQTGTSQLDVQRLFVGEPFLGDVQQCGLPSPQKLVFNLDLGDSTVVASGNAWIILWNRQFPQPDPTGAQTYDRQMVNARVVGTGVECHVGKVTAPSVNQATDTATLDAADCQLKPDGHLTIAVPTALIDDCSGSGCQIGPGYELAGLEVRVFNSNVSGQPVSQASAQDSAAALSYQLIGNDMCRPNAVPSANDDTLTVDLDQPAVTLNPLANDSANDCDALQIVQVSAPASGTVSVGAGNVLSYVPNGPVCSDQFTYTVSDGHGHTAQAVVVLRHSRQSSVDATDFIAADGFDGGHICPRLQ